MVAQQIDLMSLSDIKLWAPRALAVYVKRHPDIRIEALIHGGGHERGMRSGTLRLIKCRMCEAFALMQSTTGRSSHIAQRHTRFLKGLEDIEGVVNSPLENAVPTLSTWHLKGYGEFIDGAARRCVSTGSAATLLASTFYVLLAIGTSRALISSLRFSFGRFTTDDDIDHALTPAAPRVTRTRSTR